MEGMMNTDMSSYNLTELTPEEASEISGGWQIAFAVLGLLAFMVVSVGSFALSQYLDNRKH
ncbi:hypothetical protein BMJ34_08760 [Sinorhizobium medicae]|uniref:Class IIb bacteriocin, lactobin A/cerein 7B family n=1 Tax=Sinorhizobium medicae TaxID=110321 RepID=A0ABX4TJU9_9HYPH|nr:hypothetical protein BMJ33_17165 [Sinorhizobium medicae]PLU04493.1 hypothetical protein BMJ34_08760 [Sinorhizobium medicae]PLU18356.1 hypothetical protein BMJ30_13705 [Sinorhizobium medicae]PLU25492.1 hypothetical protein BMJ29_00200 [Sinorhizobium medicae]PLU39264.1 hypothetical protein BMJ27_05695 [Sinorhizobium medicae]